MVGCTNSAAKSSSISEESSAAPSSSAVEVSSEAVVSAKPVELRLPDVENTTGKLLIQTVNRSIQYLYNTYVITSSGGETVIVDPTTMPTKEIVDLNPVAIVSTHDHSDHTDPAYTDSYDCEKIICKKGEITTKDFHIYTVASSHSGDTFDEDSNHVCIVIEVDGLRLVHMGDTGQTKLTDDQLKKLGKIDIAFMQFENSFSDMSLKNLKGFNLAEQLNPTILIPTHYTVVA
jgi:L-ascorbate metabolism protein UlaG (beta-lactamase superfamily)